MRLFIAVRFPEKVLDRIVSAQDEMKRAGIRGRYTSRENLHLTLAFIGEYGDPDFVAEALERSVSEPFTLRISGTGNFGSILWAGFERSEHLDKLAKRIRRSLAEAGIPFDRKKFSPHITLVRDAYVPQDAGFGSGFMDMSGDPVLVEGVSLMRSERGKNGMIYTELAYIQLIEEQE